MQLHFRGVAEPEPGEKVRERFERHWHAYRAWFLREGEKRRPGFLTCQRALEAHMPELVPAWRRLVDLIGGGDLEARLLSLYRPTPYLSGCSQAVWVRDGRPLLVRNYDYHPHCCEGVVVMNSWNGVRVIAQSDTLWGVLDGLNEFGLVVSLSFGGRKVVGDGFGIPLVLRYILEFCRNIDEAAAVLSRVPSHMAYNVTVLEPGGRFINAHVSPDRRTLFANSPVATNHQREVEWTRHAEETFSLERERFLLERLDDPSETPESFVARFLEPPVYNTKFSKAFGTLYTAVYDPAARTAEYRWPNITWRQSFDRFDEAELTIRFK